MFLILSSYIKKSVRPKKVISITARKNCSLRIFSVSKTKSAGLLCSAFAEKLVTV